MRKIFVSNMISIDGFIADKDGNLDWHNFDEEMNDYAHEMLKSIDTILFGRKTYEMMASYWPTEESITEDTETANGMNRLEKIVFSRTLDNVEWSNSKLVKENILEEVKALKGKSGKDIVILGSSTIVSELSKEGLIDEFRFIVNPVILGTGVPEFPDFENRINLKLIGTKIFKNGNVMLTYTQFS